MNQVSPYALHHSLNLCIKHSVHQNGMFSWNCFFHLFSVYTSGTRESHELCRLIKYADDTALTGNIFLTTTTQYVETVNKYVDWCDQNYLESATHI